MGFKVKLSSTACYDPRYDSTGLWEGSGSMIIYFEFRNWFVLLEKEEYSRMLVKVMEMAL